MVAAVSNTTTFSFAHKSETMSAMNSGSFSAAIFAKTEIIFPARNQEDWIAS
jgi:hypothetical protein